MSGKYVVSDFANIAASGYLAEPIVEHNENGERADFDREAFLSGWDAALDYVEAELNKNFVPKLIKREAVKGLKEARARVATK